MTARRQGRFIVFEGLDGAGTSTQVYKLRDYLLGNGVAVEVSKEPTNGPIGAMIRLAVEGRVRLDPHALALAFAADRADHLFNGDNGVLRALGENRWVISDRYVLSSLAYQGVDFEDLDWLVALNRFAIEPDLTIFVDTPLDLCADRIGRRSSHAELFHDPEKLARVAQNFARVVKMEQFLGRLVFADGSAASEEVFEKLRPAVEELLKGRG